MSQKAKKKAESKTEEQKDQECLDAYKKLCDKHRRGINASPIWRYSDDGQDFRLQIQISVNRTVD